MIENIVVNDAERASAMFGAPLGVLELVKVKDDLMKPDLSEGDEVFVDTRCKNFSFDGCYALNIGADTIIRRVQLMIGNYRDANIRIFSQGDQQYVTREQFEEILVGRPCYAFRKFSLDDPNP